MTMFLYHLQQELFLLLLNCYSLWNPTLLAEILSQWAVHVCGPLAH